MFFSKCFLGAENWYGPFGLWSESIARFGETRNRLYPCQKPSFVFEKDSSEKVLQKMANIYLRFSCWVGGGWGPAIMFK